MHETTLLRRCGRVLIRLFRIGTAILVTAVVCGGGRQAAASEFGVSSYRPGLMDLFVGFVPPPGSLTIKDQFLYQDARAHVVLEGPRIQSHAHTVAYTDALFAAYATKILLLGAYWTLGILPQVRLADQSILAGPIGRPDSKQTSTVAGLGDLILLPYLLGWNFGQFHVSTDCMLYMPTGSYDRQRIIDIGDNRWAFEPDVGVTWMQERSRIEASVFIGYTINTKNTASHYLSGDEFHADFALAEHLPHGLILGMAGYAFQQTTGDSGSGAIFGPFKGRVIALGPLIGSTFPIMRHLVTFTFKYEVEFEAQNRLTGNELWLTASCPLFGN